MREININIERYNVDGICVGCLNYNRKMFFSNEVNECLKLIADIDVPDGLAVQVCWECLAAVRATNRFQAQVIRAYDILRNYSTMHVFLNTPEDLSQYAHQRFTTSVLNNEIVIKENEQEESKQTTDDIKDVEHMFLNTSEDLSHQRLSTSLLNHELIIKEDEQEESEHMTDELRDVAVKMEFDADNLAEDCEILAEDHVKQEPVEPEFSQEMPLSGDFYQDTSDDDDVKLSALKKDKEKPEEKEHKEKEKDKEEEDEQRNSTKLKNLPKDLVDLYTMTEEEMWQIRTKDIKSKDFAELKYKCNDCAISFLSERRKTEHMIAKHKPKSLACLQCDVCKSYFVPYKDNLSTHRSLHLSAFRCRRCGYLTTLKLNMLWHVALHSSSTVGTQQHKCLKCGKFFSNKRNPSYHIKSQCHQEKPQCDCCGKEFPNKTTLRYHLKNPSYHIKSQCHQEKPQCDCCGKEFPNKTTLRHHLKIRSQNKEKLSFPCKCVCGKILHTKKGYNTHVCQDRTMDPPVEKRRCLWTVHQLKAAMDAVQGGFLSQRAAAVQYSIPRRTLANHLKSGKIEKQMGRRPILTAEQENDLASRITRLPSVGYPLTPKIIRHQAFIFCEENNIPNNFNKNNKRAGRDWLKLFLKRHSYISIIDQD